MPKGAIGRTRGGAREGQSKPNQSGKGGRMYKFRKTKRGELKRKRQANMNFGIGDDSSDDDEHDKKAAAIKRKKAFENNKPKGPISLARLDALQDKFSQDKEKNKNKVERKNTDGRQEKKKTDGKEEKPKELDRATKRLIVDRKKEARKVAEKVAKQQSHPFEKTFWREDNDENDPARHPPSESEIQKARESLKITVLHGNCPGPISTLNDPRLPPTLAQSMQAMKFDTPTAVQKQCWPAVLNGNDSLVLAEAGSGKTLGYVLPAVPHILAQRPIEMGDGPIVLILVPTRELAMQVEAVCKPLKRPFSIKTKALYGGKGKDSQVEAVRCGVQIVVSTPGRLLDLIRMKATNLGRVTYAVLDEADKMLDMGFEDQLREIRGKLRPDRQTCLFSATFPPVVAAVANKWLPHDRVDLRVMAHDMTVSSTITQVVHVCAEHKKPKKLLGFLTKLRAKEKADGVRQRGRVLIFVNKIKKIGQLHAILKKSSPDRVAVLHGSLHQEQREKVLNEFKNGKVPLLIATDVAARGIHVTRLPVVVNYDFPTSLAQYVHRVGRTGRQGEQGYAFSFFTRNLGAMAGGVVSLLKNNDQWLDPHLVKLAEEFERKAEEGAVEEGDEGDADDDQEGKGEGEVGESGGDGGDAEHGQGDDEDEKGKDDENEMNDSEEEDDEA